MSNPLPEIPSEKKVRIRQYATLAGIVVVVLLALAWLLGGSGEPAPTHRPDQDRPVVKKIQPPAPIDPQQAWVAKGERELRELRKDREEFKREIEALRKELEQVRKASANQDAASSPSASDAGTSASNQSSSSRLPPLPPRPPASSPVESAGLLPPQPGQILPPPPVQPGGTSPNATGAVTAREDIMEIDIPDPDADKKDKEQIKTVDNYIPAGSFGRVRLLSGLDAPTGGQAQSDPVPFIVRLKDRGRLPNGFRSHVKDCHIVLAGYGDISSERVYARTEKLSCVMDDGRILETKLEGYIAGEDGKAGMRGRLVSKQGALIARSLLAGIAGGVGSGISQSYTQIQTSPIGTISTIDPSKVLQQGVAQGVGTALDRISKWYLERADETYPVLEVDAGRVADVVLVDGAFIDLEFIESEDGPRRPMVTEEERRKAGTIERYRWRKGNS